MQHYIKRKQLPNFDNLFLEFLDSYKISTLAVVDLRERQGYTPLSSSNLVNFHVVFWENLAK